MQLGLIAMGQAHDEIIGTGQAGSPDALVIRGIEAAVADVLEDGVGEEMGLLQDQAERTAQVGLFDLIDVDAVVADLAVCDVIEAVDEVRDGGLAGTRGADEGDLLARFGIDRNVMENRLALFIGKVDIDHAHVTAQRRIGDAAVGSMGMAPGPTAGTLGSLGENTVLLSGVDEGDIALVGFGFFINEGEDTGGACTGHDDGVELLGEVVHVAGKLLGHVQEGHQNGNAEGQAGNADILQAGKQEKTAGKCQDNIKKIADVGHDGPEEAGIGVGLAADLIKLVIGSVEIGDAGRFMVEDLDDLLAAHQLLRQALHGAGGLLLAHKVTGAAAADHLGGIEHGDNAKDEDKGQPEAEPEHDGEDGQDDGAGLDQIRKSLGHQLAEGIDVVGVMRHDIAVCVGIEVAERQPLHAVKHLAAELVQKALGHIGHDLGINGHGNQGQQVESGKNDEIANDLGACGGPVAGEIEVLDNRQDPLYEDGGNGRNNGGEENAENRQRGQTRII